MNSASVGSENNAKPIGGLLFGAASEASGTGLVSSVTKRTLTDWSVPEHRDAMVAFRKQARLSRMRRGVKVAAELLQGAATVRGVRYRALFVTLTYRPGVSWQPQHIRDFLTLCRKRFARKGELLQYVWVMELTKAGVPHYHLVFWVRASLRLPAPDRAGLWPHGLSQVQRARSPVGYLIKYASKGNVETIYPKGARIFGCGGLDVEARAAKRWRLIPLYIRVQFNMGDGVRRCRGGGWFSTVTGEWVPSCALIVENGTVRVELSSDKNRSDSRRSYN